jgi:3-dehydroquinate synthase
MGTGKSTVGRALAQKYGLEFVDLDLEVERRAGCSVPEIFRECGEAEFRRLETEALTGLPDGGGRVIAAGGGTFVSQRNRDLLRDGQAVLCLSCDLDELERRLLGRAGRPLLENADRAALCDLLDQRRGVYDLFPSVDTTGRSPEEVAEEVGERLGLAEAARLEVSGRRASTLLFGEGLLWRLGELLAERGVKGQIFLVTEETVAAQGWAELAGASLKGHNYTVDVFTLPAGEEHKTLASLQDLYRACTDCRLDRRATVVAVGGGVICDLAGTLAATYLRGLRLALIPTTLLAQVDAAIGGKVGVDFDGVKNLIGAFYPAELTLVDPAVLRTLPSALIRDGLAEVVKTGMIRSAALVEALERFAAPEDILVQTSVIRRCALEKVAVVQADPFERGERALLNFGHTVGHALEAASRYRLSHGQAVAVGMAAEARLAERNGWCSDEVMARLRALLAKLDLPVVAPGIDVETGTSLMGFDKKRQGDQLRLAVPTEVGVGAVFAVTKEEARTALEAAVGGVA